MLPQCIIGIGAFGGSGKARLEGAARRVVLSRNHILVLVILSHADHTSGSDRRASI